MSDLQALRSDLYEDAAAFVDHIANADRDDPSLRIDALVHLNSVYRYASVQGRGKFLDAMKLPDGAKQRRHAYEVCMRGGKDEATCIAESEALPLFRDILDAWPSENSVDAWWSAPITNLIGTYDPQNPPAGELTDWRAELKKTNPGLDVAVDVTESAGEVLDDIAGDVQSAAGGIATALRWAPWVIGGSLALGLTLYALRRPSRRASPATA